MKMQLTENSLWKLLFFGLILLYCLFYAPFGVNETDGGFLTGLSWQVLCGKELYRDIIYVRPPLPVWLRALEIRCLPENLGMLGERWIFYGKVGLYSWLSAAILTSGRQRWMLAVFGFVVSAHCYPAMAWHTVDGILFAVLSCFLLFKAGSNGSRFWLLLSGISLFASMLCKQSFYPLLVLFSLGVILQLRQKSWPYFAGLVLAGGLFAGYLYQHGLVQGFLSMTNGSANGGQALQHGILDYFLITPELLLPSILLLTLVWWLYRKRGASTWTALIWGLWLLALVGSYAAVTWLRQEHTAPFAQSRAMFWVAAVVLFQQIWRLKKTGAAEEWPRTIAFVMLLGITWCATISWGYSLPMLFATPWVWAGFVMTERVTPAGLRYKNVFPWVMLAALLLVFRLGYEFIYRDGNRREMTEHMGAIFPRMTGIYSTSESAALYRDLKRLAEKYGANFSVLPAFPNAHYLTNSTPPLPLDWVVNRETNGDNTLVFKALNQGRPVIFIEKNYLEKLGRDPELSFTRQVLESGVKLEESAFFLVLQL